jgi:hypothetical protein
MDKTIITLEGGMLWPFSTIEFSSARLDMKIIKVRCTCLEIRPIPTELAMLIGEYDSQGNHDLGDSVAIDGEIIVVGAPGFSLFAGAVYVYRIVDNNNIITVAQVAKLTASNGFDSGWFGSSIAIHKNYILVGAPRVGGSNFDEAGSAYLFGNPSNDPNTPGWTELQQILPNDLTYRGHFGISVAMDESIAVIGTEGEFEPTNAVYVFAPYDSSSLSMAWTQLTKLTGPTNSIFGYSVAVAGELIVVGAINDVNTNGNNTGSVLVFTLSSSSSSWTQLTRLLATDGAVDDGFGTSVSISKDAVAIVVGTAYDDFNTTFTDSGAAYLFLITDSTTMEWTQVGKFVAAERESFDHLGQSIAIDNNLVVVSAPAPGESRPGAVYVLDTESSSWSKPMSTPTAEPVAIANPNSTSSPIDDSASSSTLGVLVSTAVIVLVVECLW